MIPAPLTKAAGLLVLLLLWCLSTLSAVAAADLANNNGPVQFRSKVIPNQYIVEYHPGTPAAVREQHEAEVHAGASVVPFASSSASGGSVRNYRGVVRSFAIGDGSKFAAYHGELDAASVERLRGHELVSFCLVRLFPFCLSFFSPYLPLERANVLFLFPYFIDSEGTSGRAGERNELLTRFQIKAVHPDYAIQMIANNATDSDFDSDSDFDWDPLGFPAPQASNSSSDNCPSSSRADCPDPASDPDSNIFVAPSHNWGQARISHRENAQKTSKSSSSSNSNSNSGENDDDDEKYVYESTVSTVYVIDSGIQLGHWEFTSPSSDSSARDLNKRDEGGDGHAGEKSRAKLGKNFVNGNDTDELGHGTHVAGIVAGRTVGVAPLAEVIALKVMNGTGFAQWSLVIDALEWYVFPPPFSSLFSAIFYDSSPFLLLAPILCPRFIHSSPYPSHFLSSCSPPSFPLSARFSVFL